MSEDARSRAASMLVCMHRHAIPPSSATSPATSTAVLATWDLTDLERLVLTGRRLETQT